MADSKHTRNPSRRKFLQGAAAASAALALVGPVLAGPGFDAAGYVAELRAAGHQVEFCGPHFGISCPEGFGDAFMEICRRYDHAILADPNWKAKVRQVLEAEEMALT